MNEQLTRQSLELGLDLGSLKSLVKATAENVMLLIDTSGSMSDRIVGGGSKIEGLRTSVKEIGPKENGVPMIAFGGPYDAQVRFVDAVPDPDGGTPLHVAIPYAKEYGATRLVVVSDGQPDLSEECLLQAKTFGGQIDVVYVGNPGDHGSAFLDELAHLTGGKRHEGNLGDTKKLTGTIIGLLEGEVEERAPIQGAGFTATEQERDDENLDDDEPDLDETDPDDFEEDDDDESDDA